MTRLRPGSTLFPYTTLFRSLNVVDVFKRWGLKTVGDLAALPSDELTARLGQQGIAWQAVARGRDVGRSEEHTSELQSQSNLVCRLLLEKKKNSLRDSIT